MKTKSHSEIDPSSPPQPDPRQKRSVLWLGVIFFISGWVFFLGVIVGRGTAPALFNYNKIEKEIAMLSRAFMDSRKTQNDMETDILKTQAELEYPEKLRKKTEDDAKLQTPAPEKPIKLVETPMPVPERPIKPAQQEPVQTTPPPPAKPESQTSGKPEPIENAADSIKTAPEVKIKSMYDLKAAQLREAAPERIAAAAPERTPAAVPKPQPPAYDNKMATSQPVAIQLNSLVDKKSADALIESLRSKGISASKTAKMVQGKGVWYTVVVGKYNSSAEADAMLNRLRQENMDASLVRQP